MNKPPLGVKPKHIHNLLRKMDLEEAIIRYVMASKPMPLEWIEEYNELVKENA